MVGGIIARTQGSDSFIAFFCVSRVKSPVSTAKDWSERSDFGGQSGRKMASWMTVGMLQVSSKVSTN